MATLLPTIPHNSFSGSFVSKPYLCSTSPSSASLARNGSTNSISTINHLKQRSRSSSSSYISVVSTRGGPLRVRNENEPPPRSVSLSTLDVVERSSNVARLRNSSLPTRDDGPLDDIDLDAACGSTQWEGGSEISKDIGNRTNLELSFDITREEGLPRIDAREKVTISTQEPRASVVAIDSTLMPFRRWMSTLRRKNQSRRKSLTLRTERWSLDDNDGEELHHYSHQKQEKGHSRHQKTSSHSSSGFVTAVKSASVSLASLSVAPRSRHAARSSRFKSEHRNSGLSQNDCRPSIENTRKLSGPFMDEAAWDRALKRRKILEELVSSEESYVADLKVLTNVSWPRSYSRDAVPNEMMRGSRCTLPCLRQCPVCRSIRNHRSNGTSRKSSVFMRIFCASCITFFAILRSVKFTCVKGLLPNPEDVSVGTA